MDKRSIIPGQEYGVREPVKSGVELQHVKVIENVRGSRWKVEWIEPNPGLTDYVQSKNIVTPWRQRRAFLRDEQSAERLAYVVKDTYPGNNSPITSAVDDIFNAMGETGTLMAWGGTFRYDFEALERVSARAGIEPPAHGAGYTDRNGEHYLPWECALTLAKAFAAAEPRTVLDHLDIIERDMADDAKQPGNRFLIGLLGESRASWALVRQWAGHDVAVAAREERIGELEQLLTKTMWDLRRPNPDVEQVAQRIDRALRR